VRPHLDKTSLVAPLAAAFSIFSRTYVIMATIVGGNNCDKVFSIINGKKETTSGLLAT
jgi:hypothetical protein